MCIASKGNNSELTAHHRVRAHLLPRRRAIVRIAAVLAVATSGAAHAGLIGDTVTAEWSFPPGYDQVSTFVVGPDVELLRSFGGDETLNVGHNTITVLMARREVALGPGVTWRFTDLNFGSGIGGVELTIDFLPRDRNQVTFTSHSIEVSFDPVVSFPRGSGFIRFTLLPVPEPTNWALMLCGLSFVGAGKRLALPLAADQTGVVSMPLFRASRSTLLRICRTKPG